MHVKPVTPEQAAAAATSFEPLPPGDYDFSVYQAEDTRSAKGDDMLKLTLHILLGDGRHRTVFDYVLGTDNWAWKARHLAEAIDMVSQYESGELDPDFLESRVGRLRLKIKPASGQYGAGNQVVDYLPRETMGTARSTAGQRTPAINRAPAPSREKVLAGDIDDEIPF
jgi:hypothetical protein